MLPWRGRGGAPAERQREDERPSRTGMVPAEPGTVPIADALDALRSEEPGQAPASSCETAMPPDEWIRRLATLYQGGEVTGEAVVEDGPGGYWSRPPAFEDGGGGLVSTAADFLAFATALLAGGTRRGERVLSSPPVTLMTSDHLTPAQKAVSGVHVRLL